MLPAHIGVPRSALLNLCIEIAGGGGSCQNVGSDSGGQGRGPRVCIPNTLPGAAGGAGLGPTWNSKAIRCYFPLPFLRNFWGLNLDQLRYVAS